ncbi:prohibitin 2, putative [Trypanosoma equiperdum]|uniref:Prohibitin n=4 Tax=Trypanozoon TaxID=39700 RepID=Q4FKP3_TRYB2|nr:prohibitin, putative [Trypanosoma brucei gambiense DAL972]XP_822679.1 prohibitin, putative [Trypanosoma brucei brucei TREU927]RHW68859.1 prohibitin 2 [Trypanosoma brucei equiperdum]SCU66485.1 prohibitin 2, putative [Trypanosoma equiperdum]EAN77851.1 prohibitin, putative [Trypanosoma brucei brucei TREU927]CAJ16756.1 prohibitin, putative [Trypanosoma brucei brucei TREU927]CBH15450.1 prohibitin, putative [Trypanosoma brucei gambiense DAL972]|eukprot:XP_011777714.1 prohibitin, putative [Trypanosoma brucei gambiense DAL972]
MSRAPPPPDFSRIAAEIRKRLGNFGDIAGLTALVGFGGLVCAGLYKSIYFVDGGCCAVKFNAITGLKNRTYGEGANFAIPFLETPVVFDIRNKPTEVLTATGSRDLQTVNLAVRVLYQPHVSALPDIYRNVGMEYAETVLPSLVNEIIRAVIAQFNASDLLVKRPEVSNRIGVMLAERAKRFHIDITDVSITQMSFGKEYTSAVEAKQVAQQMAERAKWRVEQAEQEKEGAILLAKGEAEAAKLIGMAVQKNPAFITLRSLEASRTIADLMRQKGSGSFYIDSDTLSLNTQTIGH